MNKIENSLNEFWQISPDKHIGRSSERGKYKTPLLVDDRKLAGKNVTVKLRIDRKIRNSWLDEEVTVHFPALYENSTNGEVLAYFLGPAGKIPVIVRNETGIVFNFDPEDTVKKLLLRKAFNKRPYYTYLPFHYHLVPGKIRLIIAKLMVFASKTRTSDNSYPAWPLDPSLDTIRQIYLNTLRLIDKEIKPVPFWPGNKKYVLMLTHDIDTEEGFRNIYRFAELEEEYNFRSCWYVVGKHYKLDFSLLNLLLKKGFEIGLHGDNHDNKLAFLAVSKMEERFKECLPLIDKLDMRGFRSPSLLRTSRLMEKVSAFFLYDSSIPDTANFPSSGNGCGTVFPFFVNNLIELPVTIPPEGTLLSRGFTPEGILNMWLEKLSWIKKVGGVAVLITHPEPQLSGNKAMLEIYRQFLRELSTDKEAWLALPWQVANHWRERAKK